MDKKILILTGLYLTLAMEHASGDSSEFLRTCPRQAIMAGKENPSAFGRQPANDRRS